MTTNSNSFIQVQVQKNYFFEFEFHKKTEFFRVRVQAGVSNPATPTLTYCQNFVEKTLKISIIAIINTHKGPN